MKEQLSELDQQSQQFNSLEELCTYIEKHPEEFFDWVEINYPELAAQVREGKEETPETNSSKVLHYLKDLLIVQSDELYGRAHVTKALEKDSQLTALAITIADLWHGVTTVPLLFIAFKDLPGGFIFAFLAGIGMVKFSNSCGVIAAANQPDKQSWSRVGLSGMILMNLGLGLLAGPGTELAMNQAALSALRAQELIKEKITPTYQTKIQRSKETIQRGQKLQSECDLKMTQFTNLKKAGNPRASSLYRELQGEWSKGEDYWATVSTEQLPLCRKAATISNQATQQLQKAEQELDEQIKRSQDEGGELLFLKKEHPELFNIYFTQDQHIRSGVDSVRLAMKSFTTKLLQGDWSSLGFSMFSFSMSLITSGMAVLLTIAHSQREDVAQSFDQKILNARGKFLNSVGKGITRKKQNEQLPSVAEGDEIVHYVYDNNQHPSTNGKYY